MSDSENHHHGKNEVIIVKRHGGGDHDGAHGGAWKIAYADFMTAMMAFFLVMWLVNAANEETKASVASYFNPIKLADERPTTKGIDKPVDEADGQEQKDRSDVKAEKTTKGSSAASGEDQTSQTGEEANYSEADFFENPYSVLAEIAQEVGQQANISAKGEGGAADSGPATGAEGGEAYRDPFDPDFWTQQVRVTKATKQEEAATETAAANPAANVITSSEPQDGTTQFSEKEKAEHPDTADMSRPDTTDIATLPANVAIPRPRPDMTSPDGKPGPHDDVADRQDINAASALRAEIGREIGGVSGKLMEGLVVTPAEGGLLVTISDQAQTPMFNVGSAVPRREMVLAMERIGRLLQERGGDVVIRGHTDGRQFRSGNNDNWRLSMDRAHSAYFMLVRGGLQEQRVKQVSGYADRRLQKPDEPLADVNRRIEILVDTGRG